MSRTPSLLVALALVAGCSAPQEGPAPRVAPAAPVSYTTRGDVTVTTTNELDRILGTRADALFGPATAEGARSKLLGIRNFGSDGASAAPTHGDALSPFRFTEGGVAIDAPTVAPERFEDGPVTGYTFTRGGVVYMTMSFPARTRDLRDLEGAARDFFKQGTLAASAPITSGMAGLHAVGTMKGSSFHLHIHARHERIVLMCVGAATHAQADDAVAKRFLYSVRDLAREANSLLSGRAREPFASSAQHPISRQLPFTRACRRLSEFAKPTRSFSRNRGGTVVEGARLPCAPLSHSSRSPPSRHCRSSPPPARRMPSPTASRALRRS